MKKNKRGKPIEERTIWIIRWIDPYSMECKSGTREEVEAYASQKAEKNGNTYLIP